MNLASLFLTLNVFGVADSRDVCGAGGVCRVVPNEHMMLQRATTKAKVQINCVRQKDCDTSLWCADATYDGWCATQGAHGSCPAPQCTEVTDPSSPTAAPTQSPTALPTVAPSAPACAPTTAPTATAAPTAAPTFAPTAAPLTGFGNLMEGVSVDAAGLVYATHFRGSADSSVDANAVGKNVIGKIVSGVGQVWFTGPADAHYNGMKWDTAGNVYLADVGRGAVVKLDSNSMTHTDFCKDDGMKAQAVPNDLALTKNGIIFLSGQVWGGGGALWKCDTDGQATQVLSLSHRTNGIALDPDDKFLYLTEADGSPALHNRIFRYRLARGTVDVSSKELFYTFATGSVDADGMRTDNEGSLYVTRNGLGKVAVIGVDGGLKAELEVTTFLNPTNLDFGGADGKTLFVVGRCAGGAWNHGNGCVEEIRTTVPGREWAWLHGA